MGPDIFQLLVSLSLISLSSSDATVRCTDLDPTQYLCKNYAVDPITQQSITCSADNSVQVMCETAEHVKCIGKDNQFGVFNKTVPDACHYGAHVNYTTALLLSIFLGFFGIDRIYLGYYALGFVKMFSLGGLVVFWVVDIILISLQLLGPADGTDYAMAYYGPKVQRIRFDSHTNFSFYTCDGCM
ncbi:hypothetical protein L5515_003951 [Caenorhabditis briggsae]|uniref:TM2 domain-containing protein n=3 Tax=Caenorhabditis briggsae TaxID=6238 RepID=A0AAE9DB42_CAEBR|nr:hypothetical protein L3Y34_001098 [Caenorhabditis briggsae]UMM23046.1 hypothetical protein L5515_003951 [Caenorhabditis briggsae]